MGAHFLENLLSETRYSEDLKCQSLISITPFHILKRQKLCHKSPQDLKIQFTLPYRVKCTCQPPTIQNRLNAHSRFLLSASIYKHSPHLLFKTQPFLK